MLLSRFGAEAADVLEIEEGWENLNVRVTHADGRLLVRRYRVQSVRNIDFEVETLLACRARGYPVAAPLADDAGSYVHQLDGRPAVVFEYVDGVHPEQHDPGKVGRWMAAFHNALDGFVPSVEKVNSYWTDVGWLESQLDTLQFADVRAEVYRYVREDLPDLSGVRHGIVHADWYPGNLLVRDGELVAVLDFDRSYYGPLIRDLTHDVALGGDDEIVRAYESIRPLTDNERSLLQDTAVWGALIQAVPTFTGRQASGGRQFADSSECMDYQRYLHLRRKR